jgi:hypothetical protein
MKANELRIGNLVLDGNKEIQVFMLDVDLDRDRVNYTGIEGLKPIPLTKEWLLKFGFEDVKQYNDFSFQKLMNDGLFFCLDDSLEVYIGQMQYFSHSLVVIKYVHQLQNLYFALTQEELEKK